MIKLRIRHKVLLAMLGVLVPSLLVFSLLIIKSTGDILRAEATKDIERLTEKSVQGLDELMQRSETALLSVARNPKLRVLLQTLETGDRQQLPVALTNLEAAFLDLQNLDEAIQAIRFIDDDGNVLVKVRESKVIARSGPLLPNLGVGAISSKKERNFFRQTMKLSEGQVWVSDLERGWMEGEDKWCPAMVRLSTPLFYANGEHAGMVMINVWGTMVGQMINRLISFDEGSAFLIEKNMPHPERHGIYLFHHDSSCQFGNQTGTQITVFQDYPPAITESWMTNDAGINIHPQSSDILAHRSFSPGLGSGKNWIVVVKAKKSFFLAPLAAMQTRVLLLAGLVLVLTAVAVCFFARSLTRPIQTVIDGTRQISRDLSCRIPRQANDEVGYLAQVINRMAARLQHNLNEKRRLDEQIRHSEKLVSIGEMAAGLAHELNTPLGNIQALSILAKKEISQGRIDPLAMTDDLGDILQQTEKCSQIITGLLSFARIQHPEYSLQDINELMDKSLSLTRIRIEKQGACIEFDKGGELAAVKVDGHQLQQVFVNILLNALDAIAANGSNEDSGRIMIRSEAVAGRVVINVSDNGCGIKPELQHKIFDPFFTTKDVGKGTGMGLSVSYGIVNSLGGTIEVQSVAGSGATFSVSFPAGEY